MARGCSPLQTAVPATCVTVEHVGWSSWGGVEGGVLGQEAEGRGHGNLAIGAVVLSGDAGDNGVFHGNGTFRSGWGTDRWERSSDKQMAVISTWTLRMRQTLQSKFLLGDQSETLTCDALALLMDGMMWRARWINWAAQLLRFLIGCRLNKLDSRLKNAELQRYGHLWEKTKVSELCHVRGKHDIPHNLHTSRNDNSAQTSLFWSHLYEAF